MARKPVNDGLSTSHPEYSRASGGIRSPAVRMLEEGQVVFRFASTKQIRNGKLYPTNSDDWANGSWWVLEEDYRKIISRFKQGDLNLGTTARSALAVQPSWSLMDVSIKGFLLNDMYVFHGSGSTQYNDVMPNGMTMTLQGWPDITQIYVPGMRGDARRNIRIRKQKIIASHSWGF